MARSPKRRLDEELVAQGFFSSKDEALRSILAGEVSAGGRKLTSAGERVEVGLDVHVKSKKHFVSRGGTKLEGGLTAFGVDPAHKRCLDVGCSTGGFTDCLLRHGAAHVVAVDVGYAQFDWSLRQDARIELLERTNIVDVATPARQNTIDLAVCDVSFTSITHILDAVIALLAPDGSFLTLVKPQFEAPREDVDEGGIVTDPKVRLTALEKVYEAFTSSGLVPLAACPSPIAGHKGNVEYLLLGQLVGDKNLQPTPRLDERDLARVVFEAACVVGDESRAAGGMNA